MPFTSEITPRFDQLDPAGIVFFGAVFALCSAVQEEFVQSLGFGWDDWFRNPDMLSPIRHAEAEYLKPLQGGRRYRVRVEIPRMGESSFQLHYVFDRENVTHCRVTITYVFVDGKTHQKMPIPGPVREAFTRYGIPAAPEASS